MAMKPIVPIIFLRCQFADNGCTLKGVKSLHFKGRNEMKNLNDAWYGTGECGWDNIAYWVDSFKGRNK